MRTISCVFTTLTIVVTLILFTSFPTRATEAIWASGTGWEIEGNTESGACRLFIYYEHDDMLAVSAGGGIGPGMGFLGRNIRPLAEGMDIVEASMLFSNGDAYALVAEVLQADLVIAAVPTNAIITFANTAWMELRVRGILIGRYNLTGTREMVLNLAACVQAMRGEIS